MDSLLPFVKEKKQYRHTSKNDSDIREAVSRELICVRHVARFLGSVDRIGSLATGDLFDALMYTSWSPLIKFRDGAKNKLRASAGGYVRCLLLYVPRSVISSALNWQTYR